MSTQDERAAFEAWAEGEGYSLDTVPGGMGLDGAKIYASGLTHAAWCAWKWQARAAIAQPAETAPWPFVESPGEFTGRLWTAWAEFGSLLPAVRHVLIEKPPTLAAQADAQPVAPAAWLQPVCRYISDTLASGTPNERTVARTIMHMLPLEAAAPPARQPQWMPIQTAPKDGSLFLCWVSARRWSSPDGNDSSHEHDVSQVDFCSWRDGPSDLPGHGYFDPCCGQIGDSQDVTHWMPLPPPPGGIGEGE